jgi:adenosylcobinamide-GDP ribazoletransferase
MRAAFAFLTAFGGSRAPSRSTFAWFPLVGVVVGLVVGAAWWVAMRWWAPPLAGAVAVVVDLAVTGLLHVDGLADAGDGLIAPLSRERRLEVMADPSVGAFGVVSVVSVLLVRWGAFASARPMPLVVAGLWCAARTSMVTISEVLAYARPGGIVTSFITSRGSARDGIRVSIVLGFVAAVGLAASGGVRGIGALAGEIVAMAAVAALSWRRLGGYTGDVLGASGVIGETVGLVVWALR